MTIDINLSTEKISRAISELKQAKEDLDFAVNDLVEVLAYDGAGVAQEAYGGMATAKASPEDINQAKIVASGEAAIIAEFGAGYATMEYHPFAKNAPVPIEVGSFSRSKFPRGLFAVTDSIHPGEGYWIFGRRLSNTSGFTDPVYYDRIQPRHGLLNAYDYIIQNYLKVWKEVSDI